MRCRIEGLFEYRNLLLYQLPIPNAVVIVAPVIVVIRIPIAIRQCFSFNKCMLIFAWYRIANYKRCSKQHFLAMGFVAFNLIAPLAHEIFNDASLI